jgi:ATP-dependent helicase/DNAse subunit B
MPLALITGPANAGKVALLLERYLEQLEREPFLIVPNRPDVERVERDLLRRSGALLGGEIGTFDDLFARIADGVSERRPPASDVQRLLLTRRAIAAVPLNGLAPSARFAGFSDALAAAIGELESALLEPDAVGGDLGRLYAAYRAELDAARLWDRDLVRARAAERLASDFDAWNDAPVFAYGFEDLTAAEWRLLEGLAARTEVTVSLPYEPGRPAFASLQRTAEDLAALARGRTEELPPRYGEHAPAPIAHLERALFADVPPPGPPLDGSLRFLAAGGTRGVAELVGDEISELVRGGTAPEQIAVLCPSLERWRAPLDTAFGVLGIPYALERRTPLARTPYGAALLSLLRFAWLDGDRRDLYGYLRSPFSGIGRHAVDFAEGRLRGRAIVAPDRVEEETERLRGAPVPALTALRSEPHPVRGVRALAAALVRAAYGTEQPPASDVARRDLRAYEATARLLDELDAWEKLAGPPSRDDVVAALERGEVRLDAAAEPGRVAVLDLLRARTRRFEVVFVLGLEEGSFPRHGAETPFLDEEARRRLGARLQRPDDVSRSRYLFYTACSRPTRRLYLVREAASDDGSPREASPFWDEVRALFAPDDVARWTTRRPLSALTRPLEAASTERERVRAVAALHAADPDAAAAVAAANGWERRLARARTAFARRTRLRHPRVVAELEARRVFNVTELERFADCSSAWFVDRLLEPKTIDAEVDAKLKGGIAHQTLFRFFSGLPKEVGADRVEPGNLEASLSFMRRCLEDALAGVRLQMTDLQRRELEHSLRRDLEALVHAEAEAESPLVPRRFEVSFGSERSAPELQRGLDLDGLTLSGKIDRIDVDPFSARGMVVDYKSGKGAHSAQQIEKELRLQIPLYMLVLRDLVGIEPLGGVYRPLAGDRKMRGLLRAEDGVPGFAKADYRDDDAFWAQVEGAKATARAFAERIRAGDVRHDPKGGECPSWCDLWPMCRVSRA